MVCLSRLAVLTPRCVTGLSFSMRLVRVLCLAVLLSVASDVDKVHCSTDVIACVHFGSFNVCTLGDSGSQSKFLAGRPALIRRQARELGIKLLGVQEARSAAGARTVDGCVVLASGADRGTLGCELWADTEGPYASIDGKEYFFRQFDFVAIHASPRVQVVRV